MSRILVTGASGMVGRALLGLLGDHDVLASDIARPARLPPGVAFRHADVTGQDVVQAIAEFGPDVIVHLASIVSPPKTMSRDEAYAVDVTGTENVLRSAVKLGVRRLVVTSSGAAYGYHPDNPVPLRENDTLRGNEEFPYAHHKLLVERLLERARRESPQLEQVVLRVGTVLGEGTDNQITDLFKKRRVLAIRGSDSPFVFIWTQDLAEILERAATTGPTGVFNVAGDGVMRIDDIARALNKPVLRLPSRALKVALAMARPLGISRYGPEQVRFLQYRPVLANDALKAEFGYIPKKTCAEVFDLWKRAAGL